LTRSAHLKFCRLLSSVGVMAGHSRSKNGVASLAYARPPRFHVANVAKFIEMRSNPTLNPANYGEVYWGMTFPENR
jgi:hypothetical protein